MKYLHKFISTFFSKIYGFIFWEIISSLKILIHLRCYIMHLKECSVANPNTSKLLINIFRNVMKYYYFQI